AATRGPQQADVTGELGAPARLAAVIVHQRHAEMKLDVGHLEVGPRLEEAAAFGDVRSHRSAPRSPILPDPLDDPRDAAERQTGEMRRVGCKAEHDIRMVLQVLSDPRQMMRGGNAVLGERSPVADAGQHQQLRGLKRAGRQDYFAAGADQFPFLALPVFDADGALALEQDARRPRAGFDAQIRPRCEMRVDIAARRAPALAVLLGDLVDAETFLLLAIEILADPKLRLARGLQIDFLHRIVGSEPADMERA